MYSLTKVYGTRPPCLAHTMPWPLGCTRNSKIDNNGKARLEEPLLPGKIDEEGRRGALLLFFFLLLLLLLLVLLVVVVVVVSLVRAK